MSPSHLRRWIGILALGTTMLAWLFCMIQLSSNFSELQANATYHSPDFLPFFLGVGPILFSFGGASTFPTIQNDMKQRDMFNRSVIMGFIGESWPRASSTALYQLHCRLEFFFVASYISCHLSSYMASSRVTSDVASSRFTSITLDRKELNYV